MIIYLVLLSLLSVLLYLLSLLLSFIPRNLLSQKCWVKANNFIIFLLEACMKTHFIFFVFFRLLFFKGTCFKFYLIAVLICYLYIIIHRRATLWRCLFWSSLLLVALNLARNEALVVLKTLCSLRWCFGVFSALK